MSLELNNINKSYDGVEVLKHVSFKMNRGDLVGFLGPNGAGKTTTFRILTGLTSADSGEIIFDGIPVQPSGKAWKRRVGYLAEHNPLYPNMYVVQFLYHICRLHSMGSKKERIEKVIDEVELRNYRDYKIKDLSKGYRQRVGIAQSIINDPEILILDEPTSGLDPNQLIEVRRLIKSLSMDRIIILSSHILKEVDELCNRIIMIHEGEIAYDDADAKRRSDQSEHRIRVVFDKKVMPNWFDNLGNAEYIDGSGMGIEIILSEETDRAQIFDTAVERSVKIVEMIRVKNELEVQFSALAK